MKVAQSHPTLCDSMDYIVHGILQARILEWVVITFSRGSFQPRDLTQASSIASKFFISWATREAQKRCQSVQFSHSVVSDSLWPHGLQHARPPCPSPTPRVYPNSCPLSWWCHPTISSSVIPFSSCLQSFPASGSFSMSQFFAWGGQSIGVSASTSVLPVSNQDWSPLGWTDWLDLLAVQGTLKSLLQHHSLKASVLWRSAFFIVQLSCAYMTTEKTIALTRRIFVGKIMSLLFNMLSRLVITFHPRYKCLLISWLQSPSAEILEPPKIKSATLSTVSPSICHEVMGLDAMILIF